jgi:hypothetical protein
MSNRRQRFGTLPGRPRFTHGIGPTLGVVPVLLWLALAPSALAGPPSHPRLSALDLVGAAPDPGSTHPAQPFNHACGTTVDSKGDVYVASAGNGKVDVFNPTHQYLTSISDADKPCGLAVNGKGELYVSESATGKVIRYKPNAYPFVGTPVYGAAEPIDSSGTAKGIAVDPSNDGLYIAESNRVDSYNPAGTIGINEVQSVNVAGTSTGGTFTLTFSGQTTAPIAYNAGAPAVQSALEALSNIAPGDVAVSGGPGAGAPFTVAFTSAYVATDVPQIEASSALSPDEIQTVTADATGGTFTLTFSGQTTAPIAYNAGAPAVQSALEALSNIAPGDVAVSGGPGGPGGLTPYSVTFEGAYAGTDVGQMSHDQSALTGTVAIVTSTNGANISTSTQTESWNGHIGEGSLTAATGVAAYTHPSGDRYLFVADATGSKVKIFSGPEVRKFKLRRTIAGPEEGENFGFGAAGAYLAVDRGNKSTENSKCASVSEQACTAGHLLVYDDAHAAVDEFDASGEFLDQLKNAAFADAEPTAMAVDRAGGAADGTIYVTAGARLLAFGPLATPSRAPLPELSHKLANTAAVATDSTGDVYVVAGSLIHVFGPDGKEIEVGPGGKGIAIEETPSDIAVDSTGTVYTAVNAGGGNPATEKVRRYAPTSYPPEKGTTYTSPVVVADWSSFLVPPAIVEGIGINPANDHLFVGSYTAQILELGSAAEGSPILNHCFACSFLNSPATDIAVYGANGDVYVPTHAGGTLAFDSTGTEVLARITGAGSPKGAHSVDPGVLAVDQSDGHLFAFNNQTRGAVEEYDATGGFVTQLAFPEPLSFSTTIIRPSGIAVDNSGGADDGNVYVAFDDTKKNTPDLWAFGPLAYGEAPFASTGAADGLGAGSATLHGMVNPRGFDLTECKFEYLADSQYISNGKTFAAASSQACTESLAEIGKGTGSVAVHADLSGLDPEVRYRFHLVAKNKYGEGEGDVGLFGPPTLTTESALPVFYDEATLRAEVDPSGLATKYRFEFGTTASYGQSSPVAELVPGDGPVAVEASLGGLAEGTEYHFRLVAENEAMVVVGPDQGLVTLVRQAAETCPNPEFRTGLSANLPDCRAYELVTPAETRGLGPYAAGSGTAGQEFSNWLVTPRGSGAGESLAYFIDGTLPGFEGNGTADGYQARRGTGPHPTDGWTSELSSPTYLQSGGSQPSPHGVSADQGYWLWSVGNPGTLEGGFPTGNYLRTPSGFEPQPVGQGSLGTDPSAESRFVSAGGEHIIFFSNAHLEDEAAPEGTIAIYDRATGASSAEVVSLKPDGSPLGAGENADYVGSTEDGSAVLFMVGGTLYLHRGGETTEIAAAPDTFAGISADGTRVFYAAGSGAVPNGLFVCDIENGPCAGPESHASSEIASNSIFVNVSADGSHAYFTSTEVLDGAEEGVLGQNNLYVWDGSNTRFIAILDPQDLVGFVGDIAINLKRWTGAVGAGVSVGRGFSPARSTPDGEVFVFQSHARLTPYENEGQGEIFRYEGDAAPGGQLSCVSCDPTGSPASADATLQERSVPTKATTLIPNVTDNGGAIFFQSRDRLLPGDANSAQDVYEWKPQAAGNCKRLGGCLALISSGQGESDSFLYGMTGNGHDVFIRTREKLVGSDVTGSPSIYDARVGGGIPDRPAPAPCEGDACQGAGAIPPVISSPASATIKSQGNPTSGEDTSRCTKGQHKVRRGGKARCVSKHHKKRHHKRQRANHNRGAHQ